MFTVKRISPQNEETLEETDRVDCAMPDDAKSSNERVVAYANRKGDRVVIGSGDVYVMNESGKTVATYHLGNPYAFGVTADSVMYSTNARVVGIHLNN